MRQKWGVTVTPLTRSITLAAATVAFGWPTSLILIVIEKECTKVKSMTKAIRVHQEITIYFKRPGTLINMDEKYVHGWELVVPEKELPVEVGHVYGVHIYNVDFRKSGQCCIQTERMNWVRGVRNIGINTS